MLKILTLAVLILIITTSTTSFAKSTIVQISSLDELMVLFKSRNYTLEDWRQGNREVPRLTFSKVSESWKKTSNEITVKQKKQVFFRLMTPLVLMSNEKRLADRNYIQSADLSASLLLNLAYKYRISSPEKQGKIKTLTELQRQQLLERVDIIPPSLALAQAAEESGWATSRFTEEGNTFFGQWDFSGKGMTPKQQRKELGNYGLARFDSPLASVEGYMKNINTSFAYEKLRQFRAQLRKENKVITGLQLTNTLDKYSERGQAYIDSIKSMIRYNELQAVDDAYLSDDTLIELVASQ